MYEKYRLESYVSKIQDILNSGIMMKYSVQHKTSRHHGDATQSIDRQTDRVAFSQKNVSHRRGGGGGGGGGEEFAMYIKIRDLVYIKI